MPSTEITFPHEVELNSSGRTISAEDIGMGSLHMVAEVLRARHGQLTARDLMEQHARPQEPADTTPTKAREHPDITLRPDQYKVIR